MEDRVMSLQIISSAFKPNGDIPSQYTCDGTDAAPALSWTGVPNNTRSLALIVDDPDAPDPAAPKMTWVHWVLYNLPPNTKSLPGGRKGGELPEGTGVGTNDWKRADWGGPCPPKGRHRYFFKLYALDCELPDMGPVKKARLEEAMRGHVLAEAQLIGTYQH
jgi:Raf kinase inhibitor-like YbhB/YbcL family protein